MKQHDITGLRPLAIHANVSCMKQYSVPTLNYNLEVQWYTVSVNIFSLSWVICVHSAWLLYE